MSDHVNRPIGILEEARVADDGGRQDFEDFFHDHHPRLFRAMCLITRNRHEAEEIAQDAFLRIWERWDRAEDIADPPAYLYRTAMNVFRSRARRAAVAIRKAVGQIRPDDELGRIEDRDRVVRGLAALTPRQRVAVVLLDVLDLTSEEAARAMDVKPVTARVLASKGRAVLRREMSEDE